MKEGAGEDESKEAQQLRLHMWEGAWGGGHTCWALAWFWRSSWSRVAERAGLASKGMVGAAPKRPAYMGALVPRRNPESVSFSSLNCLPCLFPWDSGLSSIFRVAGLLRPVSICMAVGSGRSPLPLFTAWKGKGMVKVNNKINTKVAESGTSICLMYHCLGSDQSSQHASSWRAWGTEGHPDVSPTQQPAISQPLYLFSHLSCSKIQHSKPPETSVLSLSELWGGGKTLTVNKSSGATKRCDVWKFSITLTLCNATGWMRPLSYLCWNSLRNHCSVEDSLNLRWCSKLEDKVL